MFYTVPAIAFAVVAFAICGFAIAKGGPTERIFAAVYLVAWLASVVLQSQAPVEIFRWLVFGIDLIVLAVCVALAWRRSSWIVWVTGLQALGIASHIMNMFVVSPSVDAFYTVLNLTAYGSLLALAIGTFWVWQERRASGAE